MATKESRVTERISSNQTALVEVLIAAVIIGASASLFATLIFDALKDRIWLLLITNSAVLLLSILFLSKKLGRSRQAQVRIAGFFIYNPSDNSLYDIPEYDYGEKLYRYLNAAFIENEALKRKIQRKVYSYSRNFTWPVVAKSYARLYRRVLNT